jgi:hypothetical protein
MLHEEFAERVAARLEARAGTLENEVQTVGRAPAWSAPGSCGWPRRWREKKPRA